MGTGWDRWPGETFLCHLRLVSPPTPSCYRTEGDLPGLNCNCPQARIKPGHPLLRHDLPQELVQRYSALGPPDHPGGASGSPATLGSWDGFFIHTSPISYGSVTQNRGK